MKISPVSQHTVSVSHQRVALVTGASSGIGEVVVRRLLDEGWIVYGGARRLDRMQSIAEAGARVLELDVTDDRSARAAIERVVAECGRLDALINNAGYGSYGALEDVPLDEARRQFEVNLFGVGRLIQLAVPQMRRQGAGRIVNISSIGGRIHEPMGGWYHATKFALEGLSDCLRMELAPFGIDVVVIQPGAIRTEWSAIARDGLLRTSGATAYAEQAHLSAALLAGANDRSGAPPTAVAIAVWTALSARRPKTRYAVGGGARLLLGLRHLLSDSAFDAVMRIASNRMAKQIRTSNANPGTRSRVA